MLRFCILLLFFPFFAFAQPVDSLYFSQKDAAEYNTAFKNSKLGILIDDKKIENKSLIGFVNSIALLNQTNLDTKSAIIWLSENPNNNNYNLIYEKLSKTSSNMGQGLRPREIIGFIRDKNLKLPSELNIENPQASQIKAAFKANNDALVLSLYTNSPNIFEAHWYAGLSAYRQKNYGLAKSIFLKAASQKIDDNHKAAAYFWAGRSALKNQERANIYFENAANFPLSFYGQIAKAKLGEWNNLQIPNGTYSNIKKLIERDENIRIAILLADIGQNSLAEKVLETSWENANPTEDSAFLFIASNLKQKNLIDRISKTQNVTIANSFPIPNIAPQGGDFVLDRALIFAIMRQESRFNSNAISYVGARGLMQLMPATAAWMTKRPELKQNPNLLHNAELNVLLGEGYLEKLMAMQKTDNNLARILIAYNAGPGNLSYWLKNIKSSEDTLFFIEAIPNNEARNYAKKVLSNLWIYHKRLGQNAPTLEKIANDLTPEYEPQDNPRGE